MTLHIHAQHDARQEAWIVGSREALRALAETLLRAADADAACAVTVAAGDAKRYDVIVVPAGDMSDDLLPYVDKISKDERQIVKLTPFERLGRDEYLRLVTRQQDVLHSSHDR